jgi:hypothetical protein
MGRSLDSTAARRGQVTRLPRNAAALLVGALMLTRPDVWARLVLGRTAEQAPSQSPATGAAKKDGTDQPGRTLELRVLNGRTGRPEPGVSIQGRIPARGEGKTDADGRFRIVGTEREFTVVLIGISKPGFVPVQVTWDNAMAAVAVPVPREHTVTLEPASTIGGFVRDEQGQPIAGA